MDIRAVIIDLDGTLIDTAGEIAEAMDRTLDELQLPRIPAREIETMIGRGVPTLVQRVMERIGAKSVEPATSSLQSMFPPQRRGGVVECSPGSGGGIPITPRNGAERTRRSPSCHQSPSRDHVKVSPSAHVRPQSRGITSSMRTTSVCPSRAPRTSTGPRSA
jgi:hypothetical protein